MLELRNITKTYKNDNVEFQALKGVTFTIPDGDFVAIMGPSGSGKSTLMHILGALDRPTSGDYLLDGRDVSTYTDVELARLRKQKIGFVFQSFNLLPRTTVMRNVMLPLTYAGVPKAECLKQATAALKAASFGEEHFYHLSNQLSGGQIQRVAIARALVNNPALLLADEPTGNLDTKTGEVVLATFQKLNSEGHTIVLITHERDVAEHAKRIVMLRDGVVLSDEVNKKQVMAHV